MALIRQPSRPITRTRAYALIGGDFGTLARPSGQPASITVTPGEKGLTLGERGNTKIAGDKEPGRG